MKRAAEQFTIMLKTVLCQRGRAPYPPTDSHPADTKEKNSYFFDLSHMSASKGKKEPSTTLQNADICSVSTHLLLNECEQNKATLPPTTKVAEAEDPNHRRFEDGLQTCLLFSIRDGLTIRNV